MPDRARSPWSTWPKLVPGMAGLPKSWSSETNPNRGSHENKRILSKSSCHQAKCVLTWDMFVSELFDDIHLK